MVAWESNTNLYALIADMGPYIGTDWPPNHPPLETQFPSDAGEIDYYVFDPAGENYLTMGFTPGTPFSDSYIYLGTSTGQYTGGGAGSSPPAGSHIYVVWYDAAFSMVPGPPSRTPESLVPSTYSALGTQESYTPPPPPPNDNFADRIVLGTGGGGIAFDTANATIEDFDNDYSSYASIWYCWTPAFTGLAGVAIPTGGIVSLKVYEPDLDSDGHPQYQLPDSSGVTLDRQVVLFDATAGQTYYIRIADGSGTMQWGPVIHSDYVVTPEQFHLLDNTVDLFQNSQLYQYADGHYDPGFGEYTAIDTSTVARYNGGRIEYATYASGDRNVIEWVGCFAYYVPSTLLADVPPLPAASLGYRWEGTDTWDNGPGYGPVDVSNLSVRSEVEGHDTVLARFSSSNSDYGPTDHDVSVSYWGDFTLVQLDSSFTTPGGPYGLTVDSAADPRAHILAALHAFAPELSSYYANTPAFKLAPITVDGIVGTAGTHVVLAIIPPVRHTEAVAPATGEGNWINGVQFTHGPTDSDLTSPPLYGRVTPPRISYLTFAPIASELRGVRVAFS